MIAVFAISVSCLGLGLGYSAAIEGTYRYRTATTAISSTRKIGTNIGGTSHSRMLNLPGSDI